MRKIKLITNEIGFLIEQNLNVSFLLTAIREKPSKFLKLSNKFTNIMDKFDRRTLDYQKEL